MSRNAREPTRILCDRGYPITPSPERPNPKLWRDRGLYAAWLGHSTVLLKLDGVTILTDPVLGNRVGVSLGPMTLGLKRLVAPALRVHQLPKIDVLLLSHAHMDHFDLATLRALESRSTTVVTAAKTSDLLRTRRYAGVKELGWGERTRVGPIGIRAFEVNHWGARMHGDTYRGYNGYLIEAGRYRVLFGGDTAATTAFRALRVRGASIWPLCRWERTIPGYGTTALRNKPGRWATMRARRSSCRCITRPFHSAANRGTNRSNAFTGRPGKSPSGSASSALGKR